MRTSLVPSLLGVLGKNARSGARVFELGKVYLPQEGEQLPKECRHLGMALLQPAAQQAHWQKNATTPADDFFSLKAVVEPRFPNWAFRRCCGAPQSKRHFIPDGAPAFQSTAKMSEYSEKCILMSPRVTTSPVAP
jgi:hypothetical protein